MTTVRIALANIRYPESPDESIVLARRAIAQASHERATVLCFPECFVPGYRFPDKPVPPPNEAFLERAWREIAAAAKSVDVGRGVIIATDMFGGTPCNLALTLLERGKIEVLAGANLPSLIKLIDIRNKVPLDQAVKDAIEAGRKYMRAGSADLG